MKNFDGFYTEVYGQNYEKLFDVLRGDMGDTLYNFLQNFINHMEEKNLKSKYLASYFSTLIIFLRNQGIKIISDDINDLIRLPIIIQELYKLLTKEHVKLNSNFNLIRMFY